MTSAFGIEIPHRRSAGPAEARPQGNRDHPGKRDHQGTPAAAAADALTDQASIAERRLGMLICAATVAGSAVLLLVLLLAALA
jgi:hypothetical protein